MANGLECADVGMNVFKRNGTVADAAVALMFCESVVNSQSTGIGGGFVLTIYKKDTGRSEALIARDRAPMAAHTHMFKGMPERASQVGGLSIAVPGEVAGLWALHQKYGTLEWADLVAPAIKICDEGHTVTRHLYNNLVKLKDTLLGNPSMRSIFIDPATSEPYLVGQKIKRPQLAKTLRLIARDGAKVMYDGVLTDGLVKDIQDNGGILTKEDFKSYQ